MMLRYQPMRAAWLQSAITWPTRLSFSRPSHARRGLASVGHHMPDAAWLQSAITWPTRLSFSRPSDGRRGLDSVGHQMAD